jgi:uncharacterized iron-regulated membrane protein
LTVLRTIIKSRNPIVHAKEGKVQAQLVYPQKNVAVMIAERLSKSKGVEYGFTKVSTGFLVAPLGEKPQTKTVTNFAVQAVNAEAAIAELTTHAASGFPSLGNGTLAVQMRCKSVSDQWIHATHEGKPFWVAKSSLVNWSTFEKNFQMWVVLHMSEAYAKKRGLLVK